MKSEMAFAVVVALGLYAFVACLGAQKAGTSVLSFGSAHRKGNRSVMVARASRRHASGPSE